MDKIKDKLTILPDASGCYIMKNVTGDILYVGKAKVLRNRVKQYFVGAHDFKTTRLVSHIDDFEYIVTSSEKEALLLELNLIKKHTPPYNILLMDDKTYPYLKLSKDRAPTLKVVRHTRDRKADYFGPFPDSHAAYETSKLLHRLYPLRKCAHLPKKACLYYHMKACLAPCINEVDENLYANMRTHIQKFLNGDVDKILNSLEAEMLRASEQLNYETAKEKKELIDAIHHVTDKQKIDFKDRIDCDVFGYYVDKGYISIQGFFLRGGKLLERTLSLSPLFESSEEAFTTFLLQYYEANPVPKIVMLPHDYDIELIEDLIFAKIIKPIKGEKRKLVDMVIANAQSAHQQKFDLVQQKDEQRVEAMNELSQLLKHPITRIEIFDNSHTAGTFNVSGMVVFENGIAKKQAYRLFKLDEYHSDLDSMKEVLYRRYLRLMKEKSRLPDLIIVDGGYLQIKAAKLIISDFDLDIKICGLVKDSNHRTANLMDIDGKVLDVKRDSPLFFLLTQMQDEVHRFAITYHRKVRGKMMSKSILDEVEGLGSVRKKEIWKKFKTLKLLKEASVDQLCEVVPIKIANKLYQLLRNTSDNS